MEYVVNDDGCHTHDEHTPKGVKECDFESPVFVYGITCSIEYTVYDKTNEGTINNCFFDGVGLLYTDGGTEEDVGEDGGDVIEFFCNYRGIVHNFEPDEIEDYENGDCYETTKGTFFGFFNIIEKN